MIPSFNEYGLLPPGDYEVTLDELRASRLVTGEGVPSTTWDSSWRRHLVGNLEALVGQLWSVGVTDIFVDGSFAEDKDHPNDIDGYFVCDMARLATGELQRELNALDPNKVWTWSPESRRRAPGFSKAQLPMWHHYRVELYPHFGQLCGIVDKYGYQLEFPSAFRQSRRDGKPRGRLSRPRILRDSGLFFWSSSSLNLARISPYATARFALTSTKTPTPSVEQT